MKHLIAGVVGLTLCLIPVESLAHNNNRNHRHDRYHNHCHYHPNKGFRHCHRHRRGAHHPRRSYHGPFVWYPPYTPHSTIEFNLDL